MAPTNTYQVTDTIDAMEKTLLELLKEKKELLKKTTKLEQTITVLDRSIKALRVKSNGELKHKISKRTIQIADKRLSNNQRETLLCLAELGKDSGDHISVDSIHAAHKEGNPDSDCTKVSIIGALRCLKLRGLVSGRKGRKGGYKITELGQKFLEKVPVKTKGGHINSSRSVRKRGRPRTSTSKLVLEILRLGDGAPIPIAKIVEDLYGQVKISQIRPALHRLKREGKVFNGQMLVGKQLRHNFWSIKAPNRKILADGSIVPLDETDSMEAINSQAKTIFDPDF